MDNISKLTKLFIAFYILIFILGFFYVRSVLKEEALIEKGTDKIVTENSYKVNVSLKFTLNSTIEIFSIQLNNTDTVSNLLEELRGHQNLLFEKTEYAYGTEIDSVKNISAPEGYRWTIFYNNEDITNRIGSTHLTKNAVYELRITKK